MVSTFEEALLADTKDVHLAVRVGPAMATGMDFLTGASFVDCVEAHTSHGVDQLVGSATLVMPLPRDPVVTLGASVMIEAGYGDARQRIFSGRIPEDETSFDENGGWLEVRAEGWSSLLAYPEWEDIEYQGPRTLHEIFRALCSRRQVPLFGNDLTTTTTGAPLLLGTNNRVDSGIIRIERDTSPLDWLDRVSRLFGYRVFDDVDGRFWLRRISGLPDNNSAEATYTEGVNGVSFRKHRDLHPVVTYWEVFGARYTDAQGVPVEIRSIPASVPTNTLLDPPGYSRDSTGDDVLVTTALADAARNAHEVDYSETSTVFTWTTEGDPQRSLGESVDLYSPTAVETSANVWLTRIDQSVTDDGYWADMEGWAGHGQVLPAGNDCSTVTLIGSEGRHLGSATLSHYRRPTPDGMQLTFAFEVPEYYSTITARGWGHGVNSYNDNSQLDVSTFEIWQSGTRVAQGDLPRLAERLPRRYDYDQDQYWSRLSIALSGSIEPGTAELRIIAGEETIDDVDIVDDFEIRNLTLETCGVGEPIIA
jgi:hypothetical protein